MEITRRDFLNVLKGSGIAGACISLSSCSDPTQILKSSQIENPNDNLKSKKYCELLVNFKGLEREESIEIVESEGPKLDRLSGTERYGIVRVPGFELEYKNEFEKLNEIDSVELSHKLVPESSSELSQTPKLVLDFKPSDFSRGYAEEIIEKVVPNLVGWCKESKQGIVEVLEISKNYFTSIYENKNEVKSVEEIYPVRRS